MAYDVVIVGSGVAGLSAAYHLAPDYEVLVIDREGIGNGTSSRASGVISTPVDYPDQPAWSENAIEFFRDLDGTGTFEWTEREYVRGVRPGGVETAEETAQADGVTLVDANAYDDVFDDHSPYERALVWEDTGYFDVDDFLATIQHENVRRGVEFRPDTTVESVLVENGAAVGVETEYGTVDAGSVVVAAGSATRAALGRSPAPDQEVHVERRLPRRGTPRGLSDGRRPRNRRVLAADQRRPPARGRRAPLRDGAFGRKRREIW